MITIEVHGIFRIPCQDKQIIHLCDKSGTIYRFLGGLISSAKELGSKTEKVLSLATKGDRLTVQVSPSDGFLIVQATFA